FFAVSFAGLEMVTWSHINGYLLFVVFVLGSLLLVVDLIALPEAPPPGWRFRLAAAYVLVLLAAFCFEAGPPYAAGLGLVIGAAGRRPPFLPVFALFAPVLLGYVLCDRLDRLATPQRAPDVVLGDVLAKAAEAPTLENSFRYLLFAVVQPFFPFCPLWGYST